MSKYTDLVKRIIGLEDKVRQLETKTDRMCQHNGDVKYYFDYIFSDYHKKCMICKGYIKTFKTRVEYLKDKLATTQHSASCLKEEITLLEKEQKDGKQ